LTTIRAVSDRKRVGSRHPQGESAARVQADFFSPIKLFLPVEFLVQKYSASFLTQITCIFLRVPAHDTRGVSRSSRTLDRDAMDASSAADESVDLADGQAVWS
jgi:hypothetical protein